MTNARASRECRFALLRASCGLSALIFVHVSSVIRRRLLFCFAVTRTERKVYVICFNFQLHFNLRATTFWTPRRAVLANFSWLGFSASVSLCVLSSASFPLPVLRSCESRLGQGFLSTFNFSRSALFSIASSFFPGVISLSLSNCVCNWRKRHQSRGG